MAGLLDLFGKAACGEIAFNAKSSRHSQGILRSRLVKPSHVPKGVSAILLKCPVVKAHIVGLDRFGAHEVIIQSQTVVGKPKAFHCKT